MVATVLACLAVQVQGGFFDQVVSAPTGKNGYEEFVRAAEMVSDPRVRLLVSWNPTQYENLAAQGGGEGPMLLEARRLDAMDFLSVQREAAGKYDSALKTVRQGLTKPVFQPRKVVDFETTLPELAHLKTLARLFAAEAYVRFADGRSGDGTRALLDALRFSDAFAGMLMINGLVAVANHNIIFAALSRHLDHLALGDCGLVIEYVDSFLEAPPVVFQALLGERDFIIGSLDTMYRADRIDDFFFEESSTATQLLKSLSEAERQASRSRIAQRIERYFKSELERLQALPESEWFRSAEEPEVSSDLKTISDLEDLIVESTIPSFSQYLLAMARHRTQLRLLKLHARVIQYRWGNGQLPERLELAVTREELRDPFSNEPFQLTFSGTGQYRLFSKGNKETGEIDLRYVRPAGDDRDIPPAE